MPGERYHQDGFNTLTSTADSAASLTVNASTAHRIWLYEINMGNVGTPADLTSIYLIGQVTAPGSSGGAITPTLLSDAAGQAARSVFLSTDHFVFHDETYSLRTSWARCGKRGATK